MSADDLHAGSSRWQPGRTSTAAFGKPPRPARTAANLRPGRSPR